MRTMRAIEVITPKEIYTIISHIGGRDEFMAARTIKGVKSEIIDLNKWTVKNILKDVDNKTVFAKIIRV